MWNHTQKFQQIGPRTSVYASTPRSTIHHRIIANFDEIQSSHTSSTGIETIPRPRNSTPINSPRSRHHDTRTANHLHRPPHHIGRPSCTPSQRPRPLYDTSYKSSLFKEIERHMLTYDVTLQLYLALYLQLVPLPELVQTEIVPVVRAHSTFSPFRISKHRRDYGKLTIRLSPAPLLGPRLLRRIPPLPPRLERHDLPRRARGAQGAGRRD